MTHSETKQRLDKWLWHTRFFKTRTLAAKIVAGGHVKVNAKRVTKPATPIAPGDVLTFVKGLRVFVIEVVDLPTRRGPATEAMAHYIDRSPERLASLSRVGPRPTGKARRRWDQMQQRALE